MDLEQVLARAVAALVQAVDPERIILFGSAARGEFGPDSDLDFLLVLREDGLTAESSERASQAVRHLGVPKDLIYTSPRRYETRKQIVGTIEEAAHREGRVLYRRQ